VFDLALVVFDFSLGDERNPHIKAKRVTQMMDLRGTLFSLWVLLGFIWVCYIFARPKDAFPNDTAVFVAIALPPIILFLVGLAFVSIWERLGDKASRAVAGMTSLRRKFIIVTLSLGVFWAVFVLAAQPYYHANENIVFAFGPPVIWFLAGQIFVWAWQRYLAEVWLSLPEHLRRGLLRLYFAMSVPWVAWFGFKILIAGPRSGHLSNAFWLMLIVPIGGPVLFFVIAWVVAGFQKSGLKPETQSATKLQYQPPHTNTDLYTVIAVRSAS
jgi:hypothetical protein